MNTRTTLSARLFPPPSTVRATRTCLWLTVLCLTSIRVPAATNVVTSLADAEPGSLRQVIADSSPGDVIVFSVTGTITLTNGELVLDRNLEIEGPGATNLAISGNHSCRVFKADFGVTALISGLTICDGKAPDGLSPICDELEYPPGEGGPGESGGAIHTSGMLSLEYCNIVSSSAGRGGDGCRSWDVSGGAGGGGGSGGAIHNSGTLTLSNCVISNNWAGDSGISGQGQRFTLPSGPGGSGGGIHSTGVLGIYDSIIVNNCAGQGADTPFIGVGANSGSGGGVWSSGSIVAERTMFSANITCSGGSGTYGPGRAGDGGGLYTMGSVSVTQCMVSSNACGFGSDETGAGGGLWCNSLGAEINNCMIIGNSGRNGGGVYGAELNNCTVAGNSASNQGGGTASSILVNSIIYSNAAQSGSNYHSSGMNFCCTTPLPANGTGNITNAPLFIDPNGWSNLRLQSNSPCINVGSNNHAVGSTDLDGRPRIVGGTVDIGAYEYQGPGMSDFIAWLQGNDLPTDGSADDEDQDGDGLTNWQEWRCKTCPIDVLSVLRLLSATPEGTSVTVSWQSEGGVSYFLERSTNLALPGFSSLATNILGQPSTTSYTDSNSIGAGPLFYRVGVE